MEGEMRMTVAASVERRWIRAILGGIAGFLIGAAVSFSLLQVVGPATVYNDELQSPKLSAVWSDEIGPEPRMISDPASFAVAPLALGAAQGFVFALVAPALAGGVVRRGLIYGLIVWLLSTLSFELLGPFNLLLEPLPLVGVELAVGLPGNLLGGIVLSAIYGKIESESA